MPFSGPIVNKMPLSCCLNSNARVWRLKCDGFTRWVEWLLLQLSVPPGLSRSQASAILCLLQAPAQPSVWVTGIAL